MWTSRIKKFCYLSKYRLYKPSAIAWFRELDRLQYASRDELDDISWRKCTRLVEHAYQTVPFYRNRLDSIGMHPRDLRKREDFHRIPLLTREDIRSSFEQIKSDIADESCFRFVSTGGTTGEPVKVAHDRRVPLESFQWLLQGWWGVCPGSDFASIIRMIRVGRMSRLVNKVLWWPTMKLALDAASMGTEDIDHFIKVYKRVAPSVVWGYVGAVDHLAGYLEEHSIEIPPPRVVFVTAAPLAEVQRQRIEGTFHAPVCDQYGCCEVFWLAAQCPQKQALHILSTSRMLEFVDDEGRPVPNGEFGRVVLTDLENMAFPLIRYVNGDRGRCLAGHCACGRTLPLMDKVKGRQTDVVEMPDGRCLSGEYLTTIFDDYAECVKGFQVVQHPDYAISIRYIPADAHQSDTNMLGKVLASLRGKTRGQVPIHFEKVDALPHDRGKTRYVISEVS
jgi:phenylacetate-CoA ligase